MKPETVIDFGTPLAIANASRDSLYKFSPFVDFLRLPLSIVNVEEKNGQAKIYLRRRLKHTDGRTFQFYLAAYDKFKQHVATCKVQNLKLILFIYFRL